MQKLVLIFCAALAINAQAASVMWALPDFRIPGVTLNNYHGDIPLGGPNGLQMVYMVERPTNGSLFMSMMHGDNFTGNEDWILYSTTILENGTVNGNPIVGGPDVEELPYTYPQWFIMDLKAEEEDLIGMRIAMIALFYDGDMDVSVESHNGYWLFIMGGQIKKDESGELYLGFTKDVPKPLDDLWRFDNFKHLPEPATGLLIFGGAAILLLRRRK